jgi:hypothetical protein
MRVDRGILPLLLCAFLVSNLWAQRRTETKCVSMKNVLDTLALYRKSPNTYPQAGLIRNVKERGFCGATTPEEIDRIREAGGSPELIATIAPPAPAPPPLPGPGPTPTPEPAKEGRLRVLCQPLDCNVTVDGAKFLGATTKGELSVPLPPGPISVTVAQQDYDAEPKFQNVEIKDHDTTSIAFKLSVSRDALLREGKKQFSEMVTALGGDDGLKALSFFKGNGILQCYDRAGQQTEWNFAATMKPPDQARFEVGRRGKKGSYIAFNTDSSLEWQKTEKESPQWDEMDQSLRRLREHQLSRLIERLKSDGFKTIASDLIVKPGDETVVRAEGGGQTYRIRIGADHRPREIVYEAGLLDKGLRILYSEYAERNGAAYPLSMEIQLPDAERHGLKLQLGAVELNPTDVKDTDLQPPRPKGRKR